MLVTLPSDHICGNGFLVRSYIVTLLSPMSTRSYGYIDSKIEYAHQALRRNTARAQTGMTLRHYGIFLIVVYGALSRIQENTERVLYHGISRIILDYQT